MAPDFFKHIDNTWTLFLDRDGVINKRVFGGYIKTPEEFELLPGVLDSLVFFSSIFNKIIIITNQQGVGKGIMTEADLIVVNNHMIGEIANAGGRIDAIYYCTDLAEAPDNCRKPTTKMAHRATSDFPEINLTKSIMVGDSPSDIEFGNNAGMKTIYVMSASEESAPELADYKFNSLSELHASIEKLQQL